MSRRYLTVEEAELVLPKLNEILGRTVQLHQLLRLRAEELSRAGYSVTDGLLAGLRGSAVPGTETVLLEAQGLYQAIAEETRLVELLGGELKGPDLVDFWSWMDGETEVLLCWKLGEASITHFHTEEGGFSGRQPIEGHRFSSQGRSPKAS